MGSSNLKSVFVATIKQRISTARNSYSSIYGMRSARKGGLVVSLMAILALPFFLSSAHKSNSEMAPATETTAINQVESSSSDVKNEAGLVGETSSDNNSSQQAEQSSGNSTSSSSSSSSISIKSSSTSSGSSTTSNTETVISSNGQEQSRTVTTTNEEGNSKVNLNVGENTEVEVRRRGDKVRIDFSERTRTEN